MTGQKNKLQTMRMPYQLIHQLKLFKKYILSTKPADGPVQQDDFAMYLERFDIDGYMQALRSPSFNHQVLCEITYKNERYQTVQLDRSPPAATNNLMIISGVHGNEFAAALAIPGVLKEIEVNPKLYERWNIRIIAPVNPIGLVYGSRYNEDGYDINRDFKNFHTAGARMQRDAIASFKPDLIITLHESPQDGFFMFSEGKLPANVRDSIIQDLRSANVMLASKNYLSIAHKEGIWEKATPVYLAQRLLGIHTLGSYAHKLRIPTITTESCWKDADVEARWRPHLVVIKSVVGSYGR